MTSTELAAAAEAVMQWKRRSSHRGPRRSNSLGGKKVELTGQCRHDRDQPSHAQHADSGRQLIQGVTHPTSLVLGA